ncbi:ribulose-phosphate 3-epimerase [Pancytospora philotis]|nr:ribulose-phosphate 3-epimerase [Pancytospora philotis]KAI4291103.1 ribulose-phosphate 3-epimerase [Pancytospora philotis]
MPQIAVSILDLDFLNLDRNLRELRAIGVTHIHLDVIDTSFANNVSFGPRILNQVLGYDFVFDLHFMVASPLELIKQLDLARVERIALHSGLAEVEAYLRGKGPIVGCALRPSEAVESVSTDYVLVMTVEPGRGGQDLQTECLAKIKALKRMGKFVGVDGGVKLENIAAAADADLIVVGSALTRSADKKSYYAQLQHRLADAPN